jgi:phosphatidylglycerophosphate synthase
MMIRNILDASDGYIARKYNQSTHHGEMLDHVRELQTITSMFFLWRLGIYFGTALIICQMVALSSMPISPRF